MNETKIFVCLLGGGMSYFLIGIARYILISMKNDSLLNTDRASQTQQQETIKVNDPNRLSKKMMLMLVGFVALSVIVFATAWAINKNQGGGSITVPPVKIVLALPPQSPFEIVLGQSRVIEAMFLSGKDNRTSEDFESVTEREVMWSVDNASVLDVDLYGRVATLAVGTTVLKVQSKRHPQVKAQRVIQVVAAGEANADPLPKRIVNFQGVPAKHNPVKQKVVNFMSIDEALASQAVPKRIKDVIQNEAAPRNLQVLQQDGSKWTVVQYADDSGRTCIMRQSVQQQDARDWTMWMIGNRYIPGDGTEVLSIEANEQGGIWVANSQGVSTILMQPITYQQKANIMVKQTQQKVMRHGLASSSHWDGSRYVPQISDNDGLWTSMFAAGELMRYSVVKNSEAKPQDIDSARKSALNSLKAVLLVANVPMRDATIDARLRHYDNTRAGSGEKLSAAFLKWGKQLAVDTYGGSSADGEGFFGVDANKTVDGNFYGGRFRYSFGPVHKNDWTQDRTEPAATSKRSLKGFMARTFVIRSQDGSPPGGLFFQHKQDGSQDVISGAQKLYDFTAKEHPTMNLGNHDLPQILKGFIAGETGVYNRSDLIYKGDTSTDEVIGHLFIYKIAFDVLDENDPEEKALKQLIKATMVNFCTCLTNNDYTMVDATGQGTSWAKLSHTFLTSDFTLEDAPLKAIQLLLSFKLCHYVTGNSRWHREYQFLIEDASFRYLDLVAALWKRWTYRAYNEDHDASADMYRLDPNVEYSKEQIERHIIANIHFSDEEEAFLAFYLAFQLQDSEEYLAKYREGLEGWWHSVSRSQNALWYYIYQLAYPKQPKKDYYGNLLIDTASWQLSRHPADATKSVAFVQGSREDVMIEGKEQISTLSVDPQKVIGQRKMKSDEKYFSRPTNYKVLKTYDPMNIYQFKVLPADERSVHKFNAATFQGINSGNKDQIQASTVYTLPYWLGVYHKMLPLQQI